MCQKIEVIVCLDPFVNIEAYDFLLVFEKKPLTCFSTWSLSQWGHLIFGFASNSLIERNTVKFLWQSLQIYS